MARQIINVGTTAGDTDTSDIFASKINAMTEELYAALGSHTHTQTTESASWTIPHNLNFRHVQVDVFDDDGNVHLPQIDYFSLTGCRLDFAYPVKGLAIIRRSYLN